MNRLFLLLFWLFCFSNAWTQFPDWIKGADYVLVYQVNNEDFDMVDARRADLMLYTKHRKAIDSTFEVGIGTVVWYKNVALEMHGSDVRYRLGFHSDHLFSLGHKETVESPFGKYATRYEESGTLSNGMAFYRIKMSYHGVWGRNHRVWLYFSPKIGMVYLKYRGKGARWGGNEVILRSVNGVQVTF